MMGWMTTQVAVRVEAELLAELDWLVLRGPWENRAEVIREAIAVLARREHQRQVDDAIAAGYDRVPSTASVAEPDFSVWNALDDGDWSGW